MSDVSGNTRRPADLDPRSHGGLSRLHPVRLDPVLVGERWHLDALLRFDIAPDRRGGRKPLPTWPPGQNRTLRKARPRSQPEGCFESAAAGAQARNFRPVQRRRLAVSVLFRWLMRRRTAVRYS